MPKGHVDAARLLLDKARRSTGRRRRCDAAVRRLPEGPRRRGTAVAGQRRGRSTGRRRTAGRRYHRLRERPRRRGAAVAGQRRGGRPGGQDGATPLYIACENGRVDRRSCCWTRARRSIGRRRTSGRRCSSPARRADVDVARLTCEQASWRDGRSGADGQEFAAVEDSQN